MTQIIKELILFTIILIIVAFAIHIDRWLTDPIGHFQNLTNHGLPWPPIFYALIIYSILLVVRSFIVLIRKRKN